jgi:Co/Zn/Cd efflux system component
MSNCCAGTSDTEARNDPRFRRVLWAALLSNAAMFGIEIYASIISGSVSLQADALDFFGDAENYGISLFVLGLSLQARSKAALFKGATMAAFGLWVIGSALYRALTENVPDAVVMGSIGVLALAVNASVAVMLFRYRTGDSNMRSIWLCSRNDAFGNIAVILAASGVFLTATGWPDILVAAFIAALSISSAYQVFEQALGELRGAGITESSP